MGLFSRGGVSLSQLVRGIVKALTDGQQAIPHAREEHLNCHMEKTEDGHYKPKLITVELEPGRLMTVPTYCLAQVNTIGITAATVSCSAKIVDMKTAEDSGSMTCGEHHAVFQVHPGQPGKKSFEITIQFEHREPSEAESRFIESLDSMVVESVEDNN